MIELRMLRSIVNRFRSSETPAQPPVPTPSEKNAAGAGDVTRQSLGALPQDVFDHAIAFLPRDALSQLAQANKETRAASLPSYVRKCLVDPQQQGVKHGALLDKALALADLSKEWESDKGFADAMRSAADIADVLTLPVDKALAFSRVAAMYATVGDNENVNSMLARADGAARSIQSSTIRDDILLRIGKIRDSRDDIAHATARGFVWVDK